MLWVGMDEAGYGPNLGPLVITAVVARSDEDRRPDVWADCAGRVSRAGGDAACLWVDDSKRIYRGAAGRLRLEEAALAVIEAAYGRRPADLADLMRVAGAGGPAETELARWLPESAGQSWKPAGELSISRAAGSLETARWRIVGLKADVIGPARFNEGLAMWGSKSALEFDACQRLLKWAWSLDAECLSTHVRTDKQGGRHYYAPLLQEAMAGCWVQRGAEGPELSQYTIHDGKRRLVVEFMPGADGSDGLVAMASIVCKTLRECWMDVFNDFWVSRVQGLKPTAGYPVDARRFRREIEKSAEDLGLDIEGWWRQR